MTTNTQKPILVSGATGFLASHCIKQLLEQGYKVRGTVRSLANKQKNQFLYELVPSKAENLELVEADLLKKESWGPAVEGIDLILHVASPFIIESVKDEDVLIKPAVEGTLNVLEAALEKGAKKVVVTSSIAAIMYGNEGKVCGPEEWSDPAKCQPYQKSKTLAEKAAWKFWEDNDKKFELCTVNPSFILGPLYTYADGASEKLTKDIMTGKMPGLPGMSTACVDVRDVADTHIKALFSPNSNGKRYISDSETLMFKDLGETLYNEFAQYGYRTTRNTVPDWIIKIAGIFSCQLRPLKKELGIRREFNNDLATKELGVTFRDPRDSLREMGYSLIKLGAVPDLTNKAK